MHGIKSQKLLFCEFTFGKKSQSRRKFVSRNVLHYVDGIHNVLQYCRVNDIHPLHTDILGVRISFLIVIQVPAQIINMVERAKILNSELYQPGRFSSLSGYNTEVYLLRVSLEITRFLFRFQGSSFASVLHFNRKSIDTEQVPFANILVFSEERAK